MKVFSRLRALGAASRDDLRRLADEQAALRRVATLVARAAPSEELFAAVTQELGQLFPVDLAFIYRYDRDHTATLLGGWSSTREIFPLGGRWPLEGKNVVTMVAETGRPARVDNYADASGPLSVEARKAGLQSGVGAPIIVDGQLWGTMSAATWSRQLLPLNIEVQIGAFTELLATAIANADSRADLTRLAEEQVALRRVATLIATGAPPAEVFASVAKEVAGTLDVPLTTVIRFESNGTATLVGSWGVENPFTIGTSWRLDDKSVSSLVASTGRPARVDDYSEIPGPISSTLGRDPGIRTGVGVPVLVDGSPWGVMMALSTEPEPFPADTEDRLAAFTGLVATAIANIESRSALHRLADEQVALRRVATLVAEGAPAAELFDVVAREVMQVLDVPAVLLHRYGPGRAFTVVAARARDDAVIFPVGSTFPLDGPSVSARVFETGRPARVDDYAGAEGTVATVVRSTDIRSSIGVPVTVDGALWGAMVVGTTDEPVPADTEDRLREFTELIATAVSSANAREGLRRLAEEQAALRRVATLVAEAPASTELFAAVTEEAARLLDVPIVSMARFEQDGTATVIAALPGAPIPAGTNLALDGPSVIASILETGRPARIDDYTGLQGEIAARQRAGGTHTGFGSPIVVDGKVWGAMAAAVSDQSRVPADAEARAAGVHRARGHRHFECSQPRPTDRVACAHRRSRRRGTTTNRTQPPRRHTAATDRTRSRSPAHPSHGSRSTSRAYRP